MLSTSMCVYAKLFNHSTQKILFMSVCNIMLIDDFFSLNKRGMQVETWAVNKNLHLKTEF